jgi:2-oxoisovalerate dehydrogenase E2 component (dihydrolipoyl transacylase)
LTESPEEQEKERAKATPEGEVQQTSAPETTSTKEHAREASPKVANTSPRSSGKHATLATPAVRHLTKQHNIEIAEIAGSGKDGRVLKEDVQKFASARLSGSTPTQSGPLEPLGKDNPVQFTPIQRKMYETMTKSLSIPHFLYSDIVDFTSLSKTRRAINASPTSNSEEEPQKLSALPFIIKAVSLSLNAFPSLNAHLDTSNGKPQFTHKASHNIGFAVDTPNGLIVPVLHAVQSHSISSLSREISRLSTLARANRLSSADLTGATFTVSNIGSIGGLTVAPVIVSPQVAILGVGKARAVPAFGEDGSVVKREECVFSWSADHRVVDGATAARCGEMVRDLLERSERMLVQLK